MDATLSLETRYLDLDTREFVDTLEQLRKRFRAGHSTLAIPCMRQAREIIVKSVSDFTIREAIAVAGGLGFKIY